MRLEQVGVWCCAIPKCGARKKSAVRVLTKLGRGVYGTCFLLDEAVDVFAVHADRHGDRVDRVDGRPFWHGLLGADHVPLRGSRSRKNVR